MKDSKFNSKLFVALLIAAVTGCCHAQALQNSFATADWNTVSGAVEAHPNGAIVLSPGTVLARALPADSTSVHLLTRPYFGAITSEQPSIEVGPAALVFVRDNDGGAMVLLGEQQLALPEGISLSKDGYSSIPLDFMFGLEPVRGIATLQLGGRSYSVPVARPQDSITIVLSAGAAASWQLDRLQVSQDAVPAKAEGDDAGDFGRALLNPAGESSQLLRESIARSVLTKEESPAEAIARIKKYLSLAESDNASDEAFVLVVLDVAQRLIGAEHASLAEYFFRSAEEAMDGLLQQPVRLSDQGKALLLQQRGLIRSQYLGRLDEAATDINEAVKLRPNDSYLMNLRDRFDSESRVRREKLNAEKNGDN